jgi:GT2 family glycosyltransferase
MSDSTPIISVIIVSYNTCDMTLKCLADLYAELNTIRAEVFVVDNASADRSVEAIRTNFPDVHVIANTQNRGFGAANNQALKTARGEFLLLLNSDAFIKPGAIAALIGALRQDPKAGAVGPRLLNRDGSLQISCFRFPSPFRAWVENLWISTAFPHHPIIGDYRRWPHDAPRVVDWVIGACLLVRREVYEKVGGFDERFFMYAEETDWQRRIRDAGWTIVFTPAAQVIHLGGISGAGEKPRINRHFFQSLDYYERQHHGILGLILLRIAMIVGSFLRLGLWLAASIQPRRRVVAFGKLRHHARLLGRQLSCWSLTSKPKSSV